MTQYAETAFALFGLLILISPAIFVSIRFVGFLITGRMLVKWQLILLAEILHLTILPLFYLWNSTIDSCCMASFFNPDHRLSLSVIVLMFLSAYFYSRARSRIAPPIPEICLNLVLLTGIVLAMVTGLHVWKDPDELNGIASLFGCAPIVMLGILMLAENHRLLLASSHLQSAGGRLTSLAQRILWFPPFLKFPILLILCLPLLIIVTAILLLFGQKPDSMIRVFTDTYKHGFSKWDYRCANVNCGGHYLCSVAAQGHAGFVRPQRLGVRRGGWIICNRQLLISNAFEELVSERAPGLHRLIRRNYNRIGDMIHRYYAAFNNKWVCDVVYIAMKPAEWIFLLTLYCFDHNPENRIARQYLGDQIKSM